MEDKSGGVAFPEREKVWTADGSSWTEQFNSGMTLRDYFAGQALIGITANSDLLRSVNKRVKEYETTQDIIISRIAYEQADAMIKEKNK